MKRPIKQAFAEVASVCCTVLCAEKPPKHVLNVALNRWIMGLSRKLRVLSQAHYAKHKHSMPSTRREPMHNSLGLRFVLCAAAAAITLSGSNAFAQQPYGPNDAPNIHKFTYGW